MIAKAQTGTGKTLAFVLPILEKIDVDNSDVQALILTPTRELAQQITKEIKKMMENVDGVNVLAIYGGQDVEHQLKKLKGARHIVVATPGRLLDHIRRGTIDLSTIEMLVLDEADQMLHMGFLPEVDDIIYETLSSRQTMLFSATMPIDPPKDSRRQFAVNAPSRRASQLMTGWKIWARMVVSGSIPAMTCNWRSALFQLPRAQWSWKRKIRSLGSSGCARISFCNSVRASSGRPAARHSLAFMLPSCDRPNGRARVEHGRFGRRSILFIAFTSFCTRRDNQNHAR